MYFITLRFGSHRDKAGAFMAGHKTWLDQGFKEGVFLLSGSIHPKLGGFILAKDDSLEMIRTRVNLDPFVVEGIVDADILEINPSQAAESLRFLI